MKTDYDRESRSNSSGSCNDAPENSYIAFITAGIWKTSVYRKNFDEENSKHEQNPNSQGE
ncbi:MAG: hypothetical protein P1V20_06125 [Verrucomicrobiales bacterium]|nr:hypothetical protein [Verrucomicrobiales bacterium]